MATYSPEAICAVYVYTLNNPWKGPSRSESTSAIRLWHRWFSELSEHHGTSTEALDFMIKQYEWVISHRHVYANDLFPIFLGENRTGLFENFTGMDVEEMDEFLRILVQYGYVKEAEIHGAPIPQRQNLAHGHMHAMMKQLFDEVQAILQAMSAEEKEMFSSEDDLVKLSDEPQFRVNYAGSSGSRSNGMESEGQESDQRKYEI